MLDFDPGPGYIAALAVEANGEPIQLQIGDLATGLFIA